MNQNTKMPLRLALATSVISAIVIGAVIYNASLSAEIVNESQVTLVSVRTHETNVWKWRLYTPPGKRFAAGIELGSIPDSAVAKPQLSRLELESSSNGILVIAAISQSSEGNYVLTLQSEKNGGLITHIEKFTNLDTREWMSGTYTEEEQAGYPESISVESGNPIILVRRHVSENSPDSQKEPSQEHRPGFLFWITPE